MAELSDASLLVRSFMRAYRYTVSVWQPARLTKPLSACKVGLVTTAAFHLPTQPTFDLKLAGDPSFRIIPTDCDLTTLKVGHVSPSFDHTGIERDPNLALPITRFQELVAEGVVGELNARAWSFCGSIAKPGELIARTAPEAAAQARADGVEVALLTPV
ncbi:MULTISPECIES: glycine/sarcosine/betaine reductase selenoprotein B family protein [Chloracidobacterium]|jgi:D-proline reductase (dithiol) PrdB|uniref:D-proline reductase n=1 Tax=Chloracidobacterium thermophilum (strain B) TaxID=981222 RepID=G2LJQ7_CHLTF|nr:MULTISPECIES: glycine/sarcosine/betaine reductase selenoprotein B family protein [Chloracidobacterium]AEP13074.1 hypothetical protein Cabther_B0068 [Chloracidobacterium thermophilum B]QUV80343.1 hypothetical protein J8C08_12050 [Chloracidobacterium thermophilum]QUV83126.1 hypothetical protein J8C01_14515 [Chloracidobacterium sp. D]